jgi:membrane protein YdbS with pleckstrin-like domain
MHVVDGRYNDGFGILVATDRRLVFVDKGLFSLKVEDFPYDRILSVEAKTGMVMGQLTVHTAGGKEEIQHVTKDRVASIGGVDTCQDTRG